MCPYCVNVRVEHARDMTSVHVDANRATQEGFHAFILLVRDSAPLFACLDGLGADAACLVRAWHADPE